MLPISTDYAPMEALLKDELPQGAGWQYEPKWDGFRCLAFRDENSVLMRSKSGRDLERYFPEVQNSILELETNQFVVDGEIVIPTDSGFSFDLLLQRIHPAASRIKKLSQETPALLILFDILVDIDGRSLVDEPLQARRKILEKFAKTYLKNDKQIILSPASQDFEDAAQWQSSFHSKLDGIVAKRLDLSYQTGSRKGMVKVKWMRTADCVIGGFRYEKGDKAVASLLLGLYDDAGKLNHIGFCSSFNAQMKKDLAIKLAPFIEPPGFTGAAPGGVSRWSNGEEKEWMPLGGGLVAEFRYDHFSDGRFRHGTKLLRWRPDKDAKQCTLDQIK